MKTREELLRGLDNCLGEERKVSCISEWEGLLDEVYHYLQVTTPPEDNYEMLTISQHHHPAPSVRELQEVIEWLDNAGINTSETPSPSPAATATATAPYEVTITLQEVFSAENEQEAWEMALDRISTRKGMQLINHRISHVEDEIPSFRFPDDKTDGTD